MRLVFGTVVAFGCLLVSSLGLNLFPENHQFIYHYKGHLRTGVTKPSQYGNFWEFEGHLHVEGGPDGLALFKLVDVHLGKYNGEITKEEFHSPDPLVPVKELVSQHLSSPWVAKYRDGIVTEVDLGPDTDKRIDIDNMKRSIVSLMQIDLLNLNDNTVKVWDSKEDNAFGTCLTSYTSMKISPEEIQIKKFIDHAKCKNPKLKLDYGTSLPIDTCLQEKNNLEKSSNTQRKYFLTHPKDNLNKLKLIRIESSTANLFLPFRHYGNAKYSYSTQKLKLESSTDSIADKTIFTPGKQTILHFHIMKKVFFNKERTLEVLDSVIKETCANEKKVEEENVSQTIYILKRELKTATKEQLLDFFNEASKKGEIHRKFLIKSFGLINTKSALEVFIEKFKEYPERDFTPIINLVQTIEYPTENLLDLFTEDMISHHPDMLLAFSLLVGRVCEESCNPEILTKWNTYFLKRFHETREIEEKLIFLFALKNVASPNLIELLTPIIREHPNTDIRFFALEAIKHLVHSKEMYDLSWPIFINRTEPVELRYYAMKYSILSRPTPSNLLQIHWHLDAKKDSQIYYFFNEIIDYLIQAHDPCLQTAKAAAHYIEKFVKREPPKSNWGVNWIISDFIDEEIGLTKSYGFVTLRTSDSYLPNIYQWHNHESALGHKMIQDEIIVKGEGIPDLNFMSDKRPTLQSVIEALKRIDFTLIEHRPLYINIIVKRFNRIVNYIHVNPQVMDSYKDAFKTIFVEPSFNFANHYIDWQWHIDNAAVSDLGTIVKNQIDLFKFHSVGYDRSTTGVMKNEKIDLLFRYRFSQYKYDTIKSLNPFEEQVHTVSNSFEDKFHIKLNASIKMIFDSPNNQKFLEATLFNKKGDSISYNTKSETTSMIFDIRSPNNNNTISVRNVPPSPKSEMEVYKGYTFYFDKYGVDFSISGHHISFFDSELFDQILNSVFTESRFLGYVGSIFNIVPYLSSHRTLVNLASNLNILLKAESLSDSEIFWKIRFPVRIDDNHYDSLFIYRLLPENEEILKMKSHAIIKEDFYKINNIFYTEYIGHEIITNMKYSDNMVDPYSFILNMSQTYEGENKEIFNVELKDSWYVKEKTDEIWPVELCTDLMNPDLTTAYSTACDNAWENQSYNTTLIINPLLKGEITIETTDDDRIVLHAEGLKHHKIAESLITNIYEIIQDEEISSMDVECVANVNNVITWDGSQVNLTSPLDCYHLLVSDTNQEPQYSVWIKQLDPTSNLISLKIYSVVHLIEVIPTGSGEFKIFDLSESSKKVEILHDGIYSNLETKKINNKMVIYLDDLTLITNGHYLYILGDFNIWHQVGGLCGSFDDDPTNDIQTKTYKDCEL